MSEQYIITGCPRSGTGYTAKVLNLGHECIRNEKNGVSSWCLPYPLPFYGPSIVECLVGYPDAKIYHQVRKPADVISSFMDREKSMSIYAWKFFAYLFDLNLDSDSREENAMKIYINWNSMCSLLTSSVYRIEEIEDTFDIGDSEYLDDRSYNGGFKQESYKESDLKKINPELWDKCQSIYYDFKFFMNDELYELIEKPRPIRRDLYENPNKFNGYTKQKLKIGDSNQSYFNDILDVLKFQ